MSGVGSAHLRDVETVLRVEDLVVDYPRPTQPPLRVVSGVSFDIAPRETLSLVGESGCGKTTTAKAILRLTEPTAGSIRFQGSELVGLSNRRFRRVRPRLQMIFQDAISSLHPRRKVEDIVAEGLRVWGHPTGDVDDKVDEALSAVGLRPDSVRGRTPSSFSGGQCQRIAIARALVLDPTIVVCDEPVSALDVSVQAQILNLLEEMKNRYGLSLLFVSHDLGVVKNISDRVAVMYLGRLCEVAPVEGIYVRPAHPYTKALLDAVPRVGDNRDRDPLPLVRAEAPSIADPPQGCRFHTRCPIAEEVCRQEVPEMREIEPGHFVACHLATSTPVSLPTHATSGTRQPEKEPT